MKEGSRYNLRKRVRDEKVPEFVCKKNKIIDEYDNDHYNETFSNNFSDLSLEENSRDSSYEEDDSFIISDSSLNERNFSNNFEPDVQLLTEELSDSILDKFPKLEVSEFELKDLIQNVMKNLASTLLEEYSDYKPKDQKWKLGLEKNKVNDLEPKLKILREEIEEEKPTLLKILEARILKEDKKRALKLFNILENTEWFTKDRLIIEEEINGILLSEKSIMSDNSIQEYEEEEQKLKELLGENDYSLKYKILNLNTSDKVKARIYGMYLDMISRSSTDSDYNSIRNKIVWAVNIPHRNMVITNNSLKDVYNRLNSKLYGLTNVKERIMEILNNRISNPSTRSMIALKSGPGMGKTSLAQALAESFEPNLPFEHISLGGIEDPSIFRGSDNSWVGAAPSIILQILRRMKYNNGIVFLDEIDKLADCENKGRGLQVQYALLHIVDYTNNKEFQDVFLNEFTHDFSNIWWIFGMNDDSWIDPALKSRLDIITIEKYKREEIMEIIKSFMIPDIIKDIGLPKDSISITEQGCNSLLLLLNEKIKEGDLRPIKQELYKMLSKIHILYKNLLEEEENRIELSYSLPNFVGIPYNISSCDIDRLCTNREKISLDYMNMYN